MILLQVDMLGSVDDVSLPVIGLGAVGIGTLTLGVVQILKRLFNADGSMAFALVVIVGIVHAAMATSVVVWSDVAWIGEAIGGYTLAVFVILFASGFYADTVKRAVDHREFEMLRKEGEPNDSPP